MSDEERVMPSDMMRRHHAARGNTLSGQRGSRHLAVPGVPGQSRAGEQWNVPGSKPE